MNSNKYNITMLMLEAPDPLGHPSSRWYYVLLKEMARRGHRVDAFVACSKPEKIESSSQRFAEHSNITLHFYPFPNRGGLFSKIQSMLRPFSHQFSSELTREFKNSARKADVVHLEQLWTGWLGQEFRDKVIINAHHLLHFDLSDTHPEGLKEKVLKPLTFYHEKQMLRRFPHISAVSPQLVERIRRVSPQSDIFHTPFCIDLSVYDYLPDHQRGDQSIIGMVGNMNWYPSYSSALRLIKEFWPQIETTLPHAKLLIVGWNAHKHFGSFASDRIEIVENVPDVRPYLNKMNVFLYTPQKGSGIKVKVLEAMAQGIPVVTNSHGVEGINFIDGQHGFSDDSPEGMVEKVIQLSQDFDLQNKMRKQARELIDDSCNIQSAFDILEKEYQKVAPQK